MKIEVCNIKNRLEIYPLGYGNRTNWLLGFANPDSSIGPVQERLSHYRVPWTFVLMSEMGASSRALDGKERWRCWTIRGPCGGIAPGSACVFVPSGA